MKARFLAAALVAQALFYHPVSAQQRGGGLRVASTSADGSRQEVQLYEGSYALVIGNSEYALGWERLSGVKGDAVAVRDVLVRHGFKVEVEENLTSEQLMRRVRKFINDYGYDRDNRLIIYYAGHGYTLGSAGDKRELGYIIPSDTPLPTRDERGFRQKAVSMYAIQTFAKEIQAKHALFVFDSCFSGRLFALRNTLKVTPFIVDKVNYSVRQFITAGDETQTVPDESIFRKAFVRGLEGDANRNNDTYITGTELADYLKEAVTNYTNRRLTPQYGTINDIDLDRGDIVFVVPGNSPVAPAATAWEKFREQARVLLRYKSAPYFVEGLASVWDEQTCGYVDGTYRTVIPNNFQYCGLFSEGLAVVGRSNPQAKAASSGENAPNIYGVIDKTGKMIVPFKYDNITTFSEGLASVESGGKLGFIDRTGKVVIPLKFETDPSTEAEAPEETGSDMVFHEGLAGVKLNGKFGFIDKTGRFIVPPSYDKALYFSEGLARVAVNDKYGYINKRGEQTIPLTFDYAWGFDNGVARVSQNEKYGLIDKTGRQLVPCIYDYFFEYRDGIAVSIGEKWGYLDRTGKEILALKYDHAGCTVRGFSEGLIVVGLNGRYGYLNRAGEPVIPIQYEEGTCFSNGMAAVKLGGKWGYINAAGKEVVPIKYDNVGSFSKGLVRVTLNDKHGLADGTGRVVIPIKYDKIWSEESVPQGFIGVILNGRKGFVDLDGNEYFDL